MARVDRIEDLGEGENKEFNNFISYSKESCTEFKSQLYRCYDKNLIANEAFKKGIELIEFEINKLGAFMNYLRNSEIKGQKFR
ncbi:four helix bundle protein [Flavobacteriaceae bacterium 3-367]|uniref:four helix bundle protein n=1 Tax=Eudoraea algarum TaxID=3417568 RepID=UPI003281004A